MSTTHTVQQGDTMVRIARRYGFRSWETIYAHPQNGALRQRCPDPDLLLPGVDVFIPDKTPGRFVRPVNERHTFRVRALTAKLRLVVRDEQGAPLTGKRFELRVGDRRHDGTTGDDGLVEVAIDPDPTEGELVVRAGDAGEKELRWRLKLGHLDPLDTVSGVQARLANLGFKTPVTGEVGQETRRALRSFQLLHGLEATGGLDEATRAKVGELHDRAGG
ncbi:MAG: peptidoglycan-binding protein [Planctomycetes bacterium]|nr:peptidoglycan-binding protein [Planctomycetota bacterium]